MATCVVSGILRARLLRECGVSKSTEAFGGRPARLSDEILSNIRNRFETGKKHGYNKGNFKQLEKGAEYRPTAKSMELLLELAEQALLLLQDGKAPSLFKEGCIFVANFNSNDPKDPGAFVSSSE